MDDFDYGTYEANDDIGLEAEDRALVSTHKLWYKAEKGRVDRVAFLYFNTVDKVAVARARKELKARGEELSKDQVLVVVKKALENRAKSLNKSVDSLTPIDLLQLDEPRFKRIVAHYCETPQAVRGYIVSRLGMDGPEADKIWRRLPEPEVYLTTLILTYPTVNSESVDIDKGRLLTQWKIWPWRFRASRYDQIFKQNQGLKNNDLSIGMQDLSIECKDAKYQNLTIVPVGPAVYLKHPEMKQAVLTKAVDMYQQLNPFRVLSTEDLKAKLGLGEKASAASIASDVDFDSVLNKI